MGGPGQRFNPRSPRGERRQPPQDHLIESDVSTHAPHAGSDHVATSPGPTSRQFQPTLPTRGATKEAKQFTALVHVSTHAPHAGSDGWAAAWVVAPWMFQPTLPTRGATRKRTTRQRFQHRFNPRSPRGERQYAPGADRRHLHVSTHAPHAGSDAGRGGGCTTAWVSIAGRSWATNVHRNWSTETDDASETPRAKWMTIGVS